MNVQLTKGIYTQGRFPAVSIACGCGKIGDMDNFIIKTEDFKLGKYRISKVECPNCPSTARLSIQWKKVNDTFKWTLSVG